MLRGRVRSVAWNSAPPPARPAPSLRWGRRLWSAAFLATVFVTVVAPLVPSAFSLLLGAAGILFGAARVLLLRQAARGRPSRWAAAFLIVVAVAMPAVTAAASTPPR